MGPQLLRGLHLGLQIFSPQRLRTAVELIALIAQQLSLDLSFKSLKCSASWLGAALSSLRRERPRGFSGAGVVSRCQITS